MHLHERKREPAWEQHGARCAQLRQRVHQLVDRTDFDGALALAKDIPLAWYRVQSIANIAEKVPDPRQAVELLRGGFDVAMKGENEYKRAAVCAWLIAAAAKRGLEECAQSLGQRVTPLVGTIEPMVSRCDALSLIWQAPVMLGPRFYEPHVWRLIEAASALQNSPYKRLMGRGRAAIATVVLQLWNLNRPLAEKVLKADIDQAHAERVRTRALGGETYATFWAT